LFSGARSQCLNAAPVNEDDVRVLWLPVWPSLAARHAALCHMPVSDLVPDRAASALG